VKLLLENWRKYINENEEIEKEFFFLLRQKREEARGIANKPLIEQEEVDVSYLEGEMPIGQIYCDMDGVLADFSGHFLNFINEEWRHIREIKLVANKFVEIAGILEYHLKLLRAKLKKAQANKQDPVPWEEAQVLANKYFEEQGRKNWGWESLFSNLPVSQAGRALWQLMGPYGVIVLTGAPGGAGVLHAKVEWAKRNLDPPPKHIIKQSDKRTYATEESGKPNLLIDDWSHNLKGWRESGGIAIAFDETDARANLEAVSDVLTGAKKLRKPK
jgi:5'(3')-deoxyribonucleotidase|tara:strand:- start:25 stop:843 length:819 start_codon:yes stop_codon:yes gene_type:complete